VHFLPAHHKNLKQSCQSPDAFLTITEAENLHRQQSYNAFLIELFHSNCSSIAENQNTNIDSQREHYKVINQSDEAARSNFFPCCNSIALEKNLYFPFAPIKQLHAETLPFALLLYVAPKENFAVCQFLFMATKSFRI
jgi:hypothetical protein